MSAIDTDHVCLCGSSKIDGKLKGTKNDANDLFHSLSNSKRQTLDSFFCFKIE